VDWIDLAHDRDRGQGPGVRVHGPGSSKRHDESSGCVKCREFFDQLNIKKLVSRCIDISFFFKLELYRNLLPSCFIKI
jgi:hypothetical protein